MHSINKKYLTLFGIKCNPFQSNIPIEALYRRPEFSSFADRVETLVLDGGIASITGDSGYGKSVMLRLLDHRLRGIRDLTVARMDSPQSNVRDFYRELSFLFSVSFISSNRFYTFQSLRKNWQDHIKSTLCRPVLIIDEAQSMITQTLSELRYLFSEEFDSKRILTIILGGDLRLPKRLKEDAELIPLNRRIRCHLQLDRLEDCEMKKMLEHVIEQAGNSQIMTSHLIDTVIGHSGGNPSTMMNICDELLSKAITTDRCQLDEKLFFELYDAVKPKTSKSPLHKEKRLS
jgi:type II secretory pathway predicted ATPase ExeA